MLFFERLFGSYYFMFLKLRRINRIRVETFQAMCMVCVIQFFFVLCLLGFAIKIFNISVLVETPKIIYFLISIAWIFFGYKYFLSNRDRTRQIIEDYRSLSSKEKNWWRIISFFVIIVPVILLPIIFQ